VVTGRGGFTLIEAIVSLVISSALVALVSSVFIVQTDFYGAQLQRTASQDNARAVTEVIARELRGTLAGGVLVANDTQLVVRARMTVMAVCALHSIFTDVFFEGGIAALDTTEVAGIGFFDQSLGAWSFEEAAWRDIDSKDNLAQQQCAAQGVDTVGATGDFMAIKKLRKITPANPPLGSLMMLYRETAFVLTESTLDPGSIGLYRGKYGETLVEFASGMDPTAQFLYRTIGTGYSSPISSYALPGISAVRLVATTRVRARKGGEDDVTAGWSVNVPLRNVN
jgi:prepilin-type N-terminal cleavage/methylation domain-containing protein